MTGSLCLFYGFTPTWDVMLKILELQTVFSNGDWKELQKWDLKSI